MFRSLLTPRVLSFGAVTLGSGLSAAAFLHTTEAKTSRGASQLDPNEWREFKVAKVEEVSHNTRLFRFELPDGNPLNMPIASCLLTRAAVEEDGKMAVRPYTPTSKKTDEGFFNLVIKEYPNGKVSGHFFKLAPGDTVEMKGPFKKIEYSPNMKQEIGMLAGGTGITPMYQVIQEVLSNPSDHTKITLVYGNVSPNDILLKPQLDLLARQYPNFKVHYVVDSPGDSKWTGLTGHINDEMASSLLPKPSADNMVFVCGPPGMMKALSGSKAKDKSQGELSGMLKRMGYTQDMVFKF